MNLYTEKGWIDIEHIAEVADRNNINFIVMIGKRQVGKTYGVLKYMLDNDKRFIFMRRVKPELRFIEKDINNPFQAIEGYKDRVIFERDSEYTSSIYRLDPIGGADQDPEDIEYNKVFIGEGLTLSTTGSIRGFNGSTFTDLVFDEFIPEITVYKVPNEGDAFLNAHVTINGNREMTGRPCLRSWLMANANDINSGILQALKIDRDIEKMTVSGSEFKIIPERGIMLFMFQSGAVTEERKKGGLYRAIGGDSEFSKMAFDNEFSKNDFSDIKRLPLKECQHYILIDGVSILLHKSTGAIYIASEQRSKPKYIYSNAKSSINKFRRDFPELRPAYLGGRCRFENMQVKNKFLKYMDLI